MNYSLNNRLSIVFALIGLSLLYLDGNAQQFFNSELDGNPFSFSQVPFGWDIVSANDPVCLSDSPNLGDTPDVCNLTMPNISTGIGGQAFSGETFVSGLIQENTPTIFFHEGIEQTVNGFTVGDNYTVDFYQAVVKQVFALDQSGSWIIYLDGNLLEITAPSQSVLDFDDPNLNWDARSIAFTATATSHNFKFLPFDDDPDVQTSTDNILGSLRMGIDLITIETGCALDLGPDLTLCEGSSPIVLTTSFEGAYLWSTGETTQSIEVTEGGTYSLVVAADCGDVIDSITVTTISPPASIDLGEDFFACNQDFPIVLDATSNGTYLWSTGANTPTITVTEAGEYAVTVFNDCGSVSDAIIISESPDQATVNLGDDIFACAEEFPITLDAGTADTYAWASGETSQTILATGPGDYSVTVTNSCGSSSDNVVITTVEAPEDVSLGLDISICENNLPLILEIPETDNSILWSTGSEEQEITVTEGGSYAVDVFNQCGISTSEIEVTSIANEVNEQSIVLCQGETEQFLGTTYSTEGLFEVTVSSSAPDECDIFWTIDVSVLPTDTVFQIVSLSEGETFELEGEIFEESGIYYVLEDVEGGCDRLVELTVVEEAEVFIYVPSAFTPSNDDGFNDLFKPVVTLVGDIDFTVFEFEIYNRWGELVFNTEDSTTDGWYGDAEDGSEHYAQDAVYAWVLRYSTTNSVEREELKGSVLMVR